MVQDNIVQRQSTSSTTSSPRALLTPQPNSSSSPTAATKISSSPQAITSHTDSKPHFAAADIGIGIASAIGFLVFVVIGIWLYRQGQKSQAMVYKRHIKRISARRDEEAAMVGMSEGSRSGYGFKNGVRYKNGYRTPGDPPIHLAELVGSAPDNMMI